MLGVGWTEMLVIGIVALVVIGPKELPAVMNRIGKFAATIRRMGSDFQRELNKTTGLNEIANLRNSVTAPLKATAEAIRKEFNTTTATGEVKPSGLIKPADPKAESVVDEIKAAAGLAPVAMTPLTGPANPITPAVSAKPAESVKPAEPVKAAVAVESPAPPETKPRVRAAKVPKVSVPAAAAPVAVGDIPPAKKSAAKAKKPIESPAPVEAIAPKPRARKAAAPVIAAAAPAEAAPKKPAVKKPAAKKPAADEKP